MKETGYWLLFIISGVLVFFLLGLHMAVMHLDGLLGIYNPAGGTSISWENVSQRSQSQFFTITYVILLGAALYHGFYGLRTILFELGIKKQIQRNLTNILWITGTTLFIFGSFAALASKMS